MSSTEEDDSFTPQNTNMVLGLSKTELMEDDKKIDPEAFASKCKISSTDENNITDDVETMISVKPDVSKKLEYKIDRSQPKRASIYDKFTHPCVPKINCNEKIIFCIDMSSDMEEIAFRKNDGSQHSALSMVKRTIELFVHNKHYIDKKHEYSLMVLYESATWVREFTSDPMELIDSLEDLNETQPCFSSDLASIMQLISEKFELVMPVNLLTVQYVIRVVLIYGRSNCMFYFSDEELQDTLMKYPFLFLDILYLHEPPSEQNRCKDIYEALCDLDEQNKSYIFEVTHNVTKLHNCMAKFLAHPLQRVAQKDSCYKIRDVEPQEDP